MPGPDYWEKSFITGSARLYVLSVLSGGPRHGYGILKEIRDRSRDCCTIAAGTIYPILREFKAEGYITSTKDTVGGRVRVTYAITDKGRELFEKGLSKWETHVAGAKKILGV
jgi:DNA-binding PadR family transcriptional regulator